MIKFVFRWGFRLLVLGLVLLIGFLLLKDSIFRSITEKSLRAQTQLEVRIGKMETGLFTPTVHLENFTIYNPPEFGGSPLVDFPEFHAEYDVRAAAQGQVKLKLLRIHLREFNIVESADGKTNIMEIFRVLGAAQNRKSFGGTNSASTEFGGIDMLNLSLGTVKYTSLRYPGRNRTIPLNLRNEIVPNVRTERDLAGLLFKILLRAGIEIYTQEKETFLKGGVIPPKNEKPPPAAPR